MSRSEPPALATWLMTRLSSGEKTESMIGDLIEQYRGGRSSAWYWRQVITAIAAGFVAEMWRNSVVTVWVIAVGASFPQLYMWIAPWLIIRLDAWHRLLIYSRLDWTVINPWAYRLELDSVTSRIIICLFLAATAVALSRLHPRQRGLVVTVFLFTQVALCLPALRSSFGNWFQEPNNPLWFYRALWFSMSVFVERPVGILYGAYGGGAGRTTRARPA